MTRIIPIEPSIPGEPKVQTIPGEPKAPDNTWRANYFLFFQNCFENKKEASITQFT